MLVLIDTNLLTKKQSGKWGLVWPSNVGNIKIFLALLAKVVAF